MAGKLITVAETPRFIRQAETVWDDDERAEFVTFIAANPGVGDVVRERAGCGRCAGRAPEPANAAASG